MAWRLRAASVPGMSTKRVLVLYASTHGHTAKVADRIAEVLRATGTPARSRAVGTGRADVKEFGAYIIAGSVHGGHHQRELVERISEHRTTLCTHPSAFVSVSLTAADDTDEARATCREMIDDVLDETGWTPTETLAVAGALQFEEYNLPTRVLMRLIARRVERQTGREIDFHHDTDYTDWDAVERFAEAFAAALRPSEVAS
jgi:menaquinone-dependent protoporphyrinogen oxidase